MEVYLSLKVSYLNSILREQEVADLLRSANYISHTNEAGDGVALAAGAEF